MPFLQRRHSLRRADASERAQCTPFRGTLWRACRIPLVSAVIDHENGDYIRTTGTECYLLLVCGDLLISCGCAAVRAIHATISAAMAYKATETPYIIRCIQIICVTTRSTASSRQLRPRMSLSVNDTFALRTPGETSPVGRFVWI